MLRICRSKQNVLATIAIARALRHPSDVDTELLLRETTTTDTMTAAGPLQDHTRPEATVTAPHLLAAGAEGTMMIEDTVVAPRRHRLALVDRQQPLMTTPRLGAPAIPQMTTLLLRVATAPEDRRRMRPNRTPTDLVGPTPRLPHRQGAVALRVVDMTPGMSATATGESLIPLTRLSRIPSQSSHLYSVEPNFKSTKLRRKQVGTSLVLSKGCAFAGFLWHAG